MNPSIEKAEFVNYRPVIAPSPPNSAPQPVIRSEEVKDKLPIRLRQKTTAELSVRARLSHVVTKLSSPEVNAPPEPDGRMSAPICPLPPSTEIEKLSNNDADVKTSPIKIRYVEIEKIKLSEYINFSHKDRALIFEFFERYKNTSIPYAPIRITKKGISILNSSKKDNPLKNYELSSHLGKGQQGSVDMYRHRGKDYAVKTYDSLDRGAVNEISFLTATMSESREYIPKIKKILISNNKVHIIMERLQANDTDDEPYSRIVDEQLRIMLLDRGDHNLATRITDPTAPQEMPVEIDFGRNRYDPENVKMVLNKRAEDEKRITELIKKDRCNQIDFTGVDCTGFDFKGRQLSTEQAQQIIDSAGRIGITPNLKGADLSTLDTRNISFNNAWLSGKQTHQIVQAGKSKNFSPRLNGARLEKSDLSGLDLTGVDCSDVYFFGNELNGGQVRQLIEAAAKNRTEANFNGAVLPDGFQGANLSSTSAKTYIASAARMSLNLNLTGAKIDLIEEINDFLGAQLDADQVQKRIDATLQAKRSPSFPNADLTGIDPTKIKFKNTRLSPEQIQQVIDAAKNKNHQPRLKGLDLRGYNLSNVDLTGVHLGGCKYEINSIKEANNWQKASFGIVGTVRRFLTR